MTSEPEPVVPDLMAKAELAEDLASIDRGMEEVKVGRVRDFREGVSGIADQLGLKLDQ